MMFSGSVLYLLVISQLAVTLPVHDEDAASNTRGIGYENAKITSATTIAEGSSKKPSASKPISSTTQQSKPIGKPAQQTKPQAQKPQKVSAIQKPSKPPSSLYSQPSTGTVSGDNNIEALFKPFTSPMNYGYGGGFGYQPYGEFNNQYGNSQFESYPFGNRPFGDRPFGNFISGKRPSLFSNLFSGKTSPFSSYLSRDGDAEAVDDITTAMDPWVLALLNHLNKM